MTNADNSHALRLSADPTVRELGAKKWPEGVLQPPGHVFQNSFFGRRKVTDKYSSLENGRGKGRFVARLPPANHQTRRY